MQFKDYYATLGIPRDADAQAIRKAYRKLAREHHPDVSQAPGAQQRFQEIGEAYATLKDPGRRAAYDQLGRDHRAGDTVDVPPDWREAMAGEGLADLLDALARGRGRGARRAGPARGHDVEASVRLTLEQAHQGATLALDVAGPGGPPQLAVSIPAGVRDGQQLRLRGRGTPGRAGGPPGDLYLHVTLAPHPVFRPAGHDLWFDLALAPWEAVLGAELEVPTLDAPVLLTVPAGTPAGRRLRLRGRGLANGRGGRGDLYALVRIDVPTQVGDEERRLYHHLAQVSRFSPRAAPLHPEAPHAGARA